jgi:hypothetical protein
VTNPIGHPDWQSYAQWRGPNFANLNVTALAGTTATVGTFAISHFASVYLLVQNVTGGGQVNLRFGETSSTIVANNGPSWQVFQGSSLVVTAPALGNFVQVTIDAPGGNSFVGDVFIIPTNTPTGKVSYPTVGNLVNALNDTVNAGANKDRQLPQLAEGNAYVFFNPQGVSGKLSLLIHALNDTGGVDFTAWRADVVTGITTATFIAPPRPLLARVNNADTVNHTYDMMVIVNGGN